VADTNNHRVRVIDLRQPKRVSTLTLAGLEPPRPPVRPHSLAEDFAGARQERRPVSVVRAEKGTIRLTIDLKFPAGFHLNAAAPMNHWCETNADAGETPLLVEASLRKWTRVEKPTSHLEIPLSVTTTRGQQTLLVGLAFYYCRDGAEGLCKAGSVVWTIPIRLSDEAASSTIAVESLIP
jgi:hypothetical protein